MIEFKDIVSDDFSKKMPLKYYPRRLRIKVKEEFETPLRAVIDSEYKNKMNFPNQVKLPDPISIEVQYFNQEKLSSFLNKNGAMEKLKDNVLQFSKSATDSYLSILSLRQQQDSPWPELNEKQFGRFVRFLGIVQSRINTMSMPELKLNFGYKTAVEEFCRQYQEQNPIVWIDLREKDEFIFRKKIDILKKLVKEGVLQMIGFYAGQSDTFSVYNINLDYLYTELGKEQVLLLNEGSYKSFKSPYYVGVSKLHYHQFEFFDVISPYRFPSGRDSTKKTYLERAKNSSFLDTDDVCLKKFDEIGRDKIELYLTYLDTNLEKIAYQQEYHFLAVLFISPSNFPSNTSYTSLNSYHIIIPFLTISANLFILPILQYNLLDMIIRSSFTNMLGRNNSSFQNSNFKTSALPQ